MAAQSDAGFSLQQRRIVERLDAARRHRPGLALIANETANRLTIRIGAEATTPPMKPLAPVERYA